MELDELRGLASLLVDVADVLVSGDESADFLQMLVSRTAELVAAEAVGVMMTDAGGALRLSAASTDDMKALEVFQIQDQTGPCYEAFSTGQPFQDPGLEQVTARWPEVASRCSTFGYRGAHAFPIRRGDDTIGALNLFMSRPDPLGEADVAAVEAIAKMTAVGILNERGTRARRAAHQDALMDLGRTALRDPSGEVALQAVTDTVARVLDIEAVGVFRLAPGGGRLVLRSGTGGDAGLAGRSSVEVTTDTPAGLALQVGRLVATADLPADERFMGLAFRPAHDVRSAAAIPVGEPDQPLGVLGVYSSRSRDFDSEERAFLESAAGVVAGVMARQDVEAHLRQIQKLEAVGQLAGGVAHDFNNLLQIVTGNAEVLARRSPSEEIDEILTSAQFGRRLVAQLLDFSQQRPASAASVDLNAVVRSATDLLQRVVGSDIVIRHHLADALPPVMIDRGRVEQAIVNLVINARDAMPHGGPITVTTAPAPDYEAPGGAEQGFVRLTIADVGHGMTDDVLAKAFEPFYTTKSEEKGTGLGLAAVYGAITASNGHIDVRTAVGEGTTFDLYLPQSSTAAPQPEPAALAQSGHAEVSGRVLVVEDQPEILRLVELALTPLGHTVMTAQDGEAGLERASEGAIDVLITDVSMPGMQGPELAAKIRQMHPDVKILYMSGYSAARVTGDATTEFIQKPFSLNDLVTRVTRLLT